MARRPNESECSITLKSGHIIRIVGLDIYDNLRGSGLWFFVGDEWADCKPESWNEVIRPMLSTSKGHALKIGTPKGFNDFHDEWQKGQEGEFKKPDYKSYHYTTAQGGNVTKEEIQSSFESMGTREFDQEYNASFLNFGGRVVYAFDRQKHVRSCAFDPNKPLHIGMDFNVNPMSAVVLQIDGDISYQVDEIIIPTSNTHEMCDEIARKYGVQHFNPATGEALCPSVAHITVYPDPAGAQRRTSAQGKTDISILRDRGFQVIALRSHPLVRDRITVTNSRFETASGLIRRYVDPKCKKSIKAYEALVYKEGTNDPDKEGGFDHPVDALGYFDFAMYARSTPGIISSAVIAR